MIFDEKCILCGKMCDNLNGECLNSIHPEATVIANYESYKIYIGDYIVSYLNGKYRLKRENYLEIFDNSNFNIKNKITPSLKENSVFKCVIPTDHIPISTEEQIKNLLMLK